MTSTKLLRIVRGVRECRTRKVRTLSDRILFDRANRFFLKRVGWPYYKVMMSTRGFIGHLPEQVRSRARFILDEVMSSLFEFDDLGRLAAK